MISNVDFKSIPSLLSWERGLKFIIATVIPHRVTVAPLVGAWIEINIDSKLKDYVFSRSSRGSVD